MVVDEVEVAVHPVVGKVSAACGLTAVSGHWTRWRHFNEAMLDRVAQAIATSERLHDGELLVVVETSLPNGTPESHARALEVFGLQRVWDTADGTGILLYIALGDHCIEIVTDRGIDVEEAVWEQVCERLQARFAKGEYVDGLIAAIEQIENVLQANLPPASEPARNDLSDRPVML